MTQFNGPGQASHQASHPWGLNVPRSSHFVIYGIQDLWKLHFGTEIQMFILYGKIKFNLNDQNNVNTVSLSDRKT